MFRIPGRGVLRVCLVVTAVTLPACSDDTETAPPKGPESFAIGQVGTASSVVTDRGAELSVLCDEPLVIWIAPNTETQYEPYELGDFELAPPGDCGGEVDCGWIELTLTPPEGSQFVSPGLKPDIGPYRAAQSVIRVDAPATTHGWLAGVWTLRVALMDSTGEHVNSEKTGKPLEDEFSINLVSTCPTATQ